MAAKTTRHAVTQGLMCMLAQRPGSTCMRPSPPLEGTSRAAARIHHLSASRNGCSPGGRRRVAGTQPVHYLVGTRPQLLWLQRAIAGVVPLRCDLRMASGQGSAHAGLLASADWAASAQRSCPVANFGSPDVAVTAGAGVTDPSAREPGAHSDCVWCLAHVLRRMPLRYKLWPTAEQLLLCAQAPG